MRTRAYYLQLEGVNEKGEAKREGALYLVVLPADESLYEEVNKGCYSAYYVPEDKALKHGKAYALGLEFDLEKPERYRVKGFDEEEELYFFEEGLSMKEGLKEAFRLLMDRLTSLGYGRDFNVVRDLGAPSEELMRECLLEVIKER